MGIERGPNESLAETTARAMGITVRELRAKLWVRYLSGTSACAAVSTCAKGEV
jgi:hypothetical protein